MLLRQLRYFVAIADCGSFTKAADECFVSESALSQQMKALERDLGVELVRRRGRSFELTSAGTYLVGRAREIIREVDEARDEAVRLGQDDELRLRVGYLSSFSGLELSGAVARFSSIYPEVSIDVAAGSHEELYGRLTSGSIDLVLSDQRRAFSADYENLILVTYPSLAEFSCRSDLAVRDCLDVSDLRRLPCIVVAPQGQEQAEREYYGSYLGLGSDLLFVDSLDEGRLMVIGNRGYLPVWVAPDAPASDAAVRRLPLLKAGEPISRTYCAFWPKARSGYYVEEFAEALRREYLDGEKDS